MAEYVPICPHCGYWHDGRIVTVCIAREGGIDRSPWSQAERDAWRVQARRLSPSIQFAPSSAQIQDRFGARNRSDREASLAFRKEQK